MSLWVMRHPKVIVQEPTCYGVSEVVLDEAHLMQCAHVIGQKWPQGVRVVCSQMQRTQQLAQRLQMLNSAYGHFSVDARLNEMDFGCWEGVPWAQIPKQAFDVWLSDFAHHRFGGKESVQQLIDRVSQALAGYLQEDIGGCARRENNREEQKADQPVLWLTHAGVIRALNFLDRMVGLREIKDRDRLITRLGSIKIQTVDQWPDSTVEFGGLVRFL